jgi:hypothetical protein
MFDGGLRAHDGQRQLVERRSCTAPVKFNMRDQHQPDIGGRRMRAVDEPPRMTPGPEKEHRVLVLERNSKPAAAARPGILGKR